jgi:hypothetical protein
MSDDNHGSGGNGSDGDGEEQHIELLDKPRAQHYVFAHVALPQVAFHDPIGTVGVLHSEQAEPFLERLWDDVANTCRKNGEAADLSFADLKFTTTRVEGFPVVLVAMPRAQAVAEAILCAIVLHLDADKLQNVPQDDWPDAADVSFFTLEMGVNVEDNTLRTVLCEWTKDRQHQNYGDGPPPDVKIFLAAIQALLQMRGALPKNEN